MPPRFTTSYPLPITRRGQLVAGDENGDPSPIEPGEDGQVLVMDGLDPAWTTSLPDHNAVTVEDSSAIDLTLTDQHLRADAVFGTTAGTIAEGGHGHAQLHDPVTVADSGSIDLTLTGQQVSAAAIFGTTAGTVSEGNHGHAQLHDPVTVADTASLDLTVTGQQVSGVVLPAGISHNSLSGLTTGDPHTQYVKKAGDTMTGSLTTTSLSVLNAASRSILLIAESVSDLAYVDFYTGNANPAVVQAEIEASGDTASSYGGTLNLRAATVQHNGVSLDDKYVNASGDTMTGSLTINTSSTTAHTIRRPANDELPASLRYVKDRAGGGVIANDIISEFSADAYNSTPTQKSFARIRTTALNPNEGVEEANMTFAVMDGGTLSERLVVSGDGIAVTGGSATLNGVSLVSHAIADAKGDLVVGTGADALARVAVGANNQVLIADSTQTAGVRWGAAGTGDVDLHTANTSVPAGNTIANTSTQTAFASTATLSANTLSAGKVVRLRARGHLSTTGTPTLRFRVRAVGGVTTVLAVSEAISLGTLTNTMWGIEFSLICFTAGSLGTVDSQGMLQIAVATTGVLQTHPMLNTATVSLDTTVQQAIEVTAAWSAASASNTVTMRQFMLEVLG